MTVTEDFECVTTKDGYELYVRKVCPIRKNDASRLQDLVSNGTETNNLNNPIAPQHLVTLSK